MRHHICIQCSSVLVLSIQLEVLLFKDVEIVYGIVCGSSFFVQ